MSDEPITMNDDLNSAETSFTNSTNGNNGHSGQELVQDPFKDEASKLNKHDRKLKVVPKVRLNKKLLNILLYAGCGVVGIMFIMIFTPQFDKNNKAKTEEEQKKAQVQIPNLLAIDDKDYLAKKELEKNEAPVDELNKVKDKATNVTYEDYKKYDRRKNEVPVIIKDNNKANNSHSVQNNSTNTENYEKRPQLYYNIKIDEDKTNYAAKSDDHANEFDLLAKQIEAQSTDDFKKQNGQKDKKEFLESRADDYSNYLEAAYVKPLDVSHEIKAGTLIPITLITGISSDLPGTVIAQINADVYDSITGSNVLLPAGSRVIGTYDSSISFGQERVLIAWDRVIRPDDGISINLRGMQGTDLDGKSGMKGQVNNHFMDSVQATALASAFNIGANALANWLTNLTALKNLIASNSDSTKSTTESVADDLAKKLTTKMINQQPTIELEAGSTGKIIVTKDIILPAFNRENYNE